jgi:hypothetical protein
MSRLDLADLSRVFIDPTANADEERFHAVRATRFAKIQITRTSAVPIALSSHS